LIALSSGTNSLFFFGFFFAILVASFRWGFASGVRTVLVSAVIFTIVSYATTPSEPGFEFNRFLLRSTSILLLGYMIAYWGGAELLLKRKLALLREVNTLSNPRFGVDRTLGRVMERMRAFYESDASLIVDADAGGGESSVRRASRKDPDAAVRAEPIPKELADLLLGLPTAYAIIYCSKWPRWWPAQQKRFAGYDITIWTRLKEAPPICERLAGMLDTESFVSVPVRRNDQIVERLYLTRKRAFHISDIDFLLQVLEQVTPVMDNVRLIDRLASDAAEEERQRLARTVHDSVIQTYLGLQIGLTGVRHKIESGTNAIPEVDQLMKMTENGVADLRRFVLSLGEPGKQEGSLLTAAQRVTSCLLAYQARPS